ncbi:spectrin beta chain, non-erythrocytic 5-like isoform X3 [Eleutherodactylus coqui]|uniref:spectrin beta chain, non-erythrocytic 5-like isoform X3 n=1 Tax=Eleutherodactylus coqui TaxID=57060 RepID=UPI0034633D1D
MRKPQPFTIGTRLSIPKCPDLSLPSGGADGASESRNVSDRVSHYLLQVPPPSPPRRAAHSRSPVACLTDRDHLSSGSPVRSITKITLSRQAEGAALREGTAATSSRPLAKTSHGNCNNNNSRGLRPVLPDAADFPHDWSVTDPRMIIGAAECHTTAKCPGPLSDFTLSDAVRTAPSAGSPLIRSERASSDNIARLSREIQQAESWVRCKVQDLTDGGAVCPNLIHRDIQAFEGTVIKLSQMVGHMSRTHPAAAASVHSQLQTLRVQWQLLKQKAVIENCAVGGATTLLEFNKKADELEIWMREKEEIPPLHVLLDESNDKVQITRRILDLKQEQIHYCTLQENINSLAQKLEKQGRPESRAASTRRKHLNRMWLRLQTSLHEHHQSLQLALEAASLWHQADTILRAIEEKSCCTWVKSRDDGRGDQDLRDIASQIMMLDVTVSQVSNLHPLLSSRALHKHRQVKEGWARLQHTLRSEKTSRTAPSTIPTREPGDCLTSGTPEHSSVGNQEQSLLGSGGPQTEKMNSGPQRQTRSPDGGLRSPEPTRSLTSEPETGHRPHGPSETPEVRHLLQDLTSTTQWLQDVELLLSEPAAMRSPELIRKDLKQVSLLEREVRSRGSALQCLRGKAKRCRKPNWAVTEEMEVKVKVQEVEERFQTLQDALRRRVSDLRDTLVLSEFMKVVQMEEERKKKETIATRGTARGDPHGPAAGRTQSFTPLEELQEAVEMLNDAVKERERALAVSREAAELESRVLALSQMMVATRAKLLDVRSQLEEVEEEFVAVRSETDLRDLQGVFSQQQQVETDMSGRIGMEVRKLQEQKEQLQDLCPNRSLSAGRSIEDALRTWADLQTLIQENQARLQKTERLREFFLRYLGMISWTEVTRGQILSESPRGRLSPAQREELERMMEGKLKDFEALAGIGWKLIGEDHLLAQMIRQRLEEVQGLLSWLLMRWRCQKRQRIMGNQTQKSITSEADDYMDAPKVTPSSGAFEEFECPEDEDATLRPAPRGPILRKYRRRALSPILYQPPPGRPPVGTDMVEGVHMPEDCSRKCAKGPLWLEPKNPPTESASPEPQEEAVMVTRKLDFHLMEGPLEKKHVLQVGGKKASSRTWGTFYAVLVRKTLCFYHDHKHSTKSSASAPPLHLTGAVCSLELDYTKRDNCFRLRLMDGSEYLFRAPNLESLQQWVTKLRHNSGMEDSDLLRNAALTSDISPRIMSRSLMPDLCPPTPARAAIMVPVVNPPYWKKAENVASEIAKPNSHHQLPGRLPESDNDGDPDTNLTMRRRSQSFSSVVYQKVTPVSSPRETSSSYSVTVYIDEPLIPRGRCHSFAAPQGEWISRHTADLKPRNKSVFRKFFRKKE